MTATPNTCERYSFVHWTENGRVVSNSKNYTFTLNGNVTLIADFDEGDVQLHLPGARRGGALRLVTDNFRATSPKNFRAMT